MALLKIVFFIVTMLSLLVLGGGKKNRWGCAGNIDCMQACRRTCSNFLRPLCYSNQCYCQALVPSPTLTYPRDYRRMNANPTDTEDIFDYDVKQI